MFIRRIKTLLLSIFLLFLTASVLLFLSIRSEESHLENCKSLGISCEPGRIQQFTREMWQQGQILFKKW